LNCHSPCEEEEEEEEEEEKDKETEEVPAGWVCWPASTEAMYRRRSFSKSQNRTTWEGILKAVVTWSVCPAVRASNETVEMGSRISDLADGAGRD
jgi:hypothetical protein